MKTQRLADDDSGFVMMAIILLAMVIAVIVAVYFFPFYTIGALLCVGAIVLLFNGTLDPRIAVVMIISGGIVVACGVFL